MFQVMIFLTKNGFLENGRSVSNESLVVQLQLREAVNWKKGSRFSATFPLHEAVKQNNAYITSRLLVFGSDPWLKDGWGKTAYQHAKGKETIAKIFRSMGCAQDSPMWSGSRLMRSPPPPGFEEFFAKLAEDPLVQVRNSDLEWFESLCSLLYFAQWRCQSFERMAFPFKGSNVIGSNVKSNQYNLKLQQLDLEHQWS